MSWNPIGQPEPETTPGSALGYLARVLGTVAVFSVVMAVIVCTIKPAKPRQAPAPACMEARP